MDKSDVIALGLFAVVIGEVAGFTLAGFGAGYAASKKFGLPGWIALGTAALGLVVALIRIKKLADQFEKSDQD